MTADAFQRIADRKPAPRRSVAVPGRRTARIAYVTDRGAYCSPIGDDTRSPIGPCKGGWYRDTSSCAAGAHDHSLVPLPPGAVVLLETTADGDWIAAVDWSSLP